MAFLTRKLIPRFAGKFLSRPSQGNFILEHERNFFLLGFGNQEFNSPRNYYFGKKNIPKLIGLSTTSSVFGWLDFSANFHLSFQTVFRSTLRKLQYQFAVISIIQWQSTDPLWILFYFILFHLFPQLNRRIYFSLLTWNLLFTLICLTSSWSTFPQFAQSILSRNEFVISSRGFVNICTCFCFSKQYLNIQSDRKKVAAAWQVAHFKFCLAITH